MNCSAPNCTVPATLQWQREGTEIEARGHHENLRHARQEIIEHERLNAQTHLSELRAQLWRLEQFDAAQAEIVGGERVKPEVLARITAAIGDAQKTLDGITDLPLAEPQPVTLAVYGCPVHHPTDPHVVHPSHCSSEGPCSCS